MSERTTPETDAAVKESNGQWSFVLKETCQRLERERDEARAERDILRLNSLGTIQLNIPVTTDWKEETK